MPLYEYECRRCHHHFETLVRRGDAPACPSCQSGDLERTVSQFAVTTPGTSQARLKDARKAHKSGQKDKLIAEKEARDSHHH
jgi:putative FmdB family regulatory protein